MGIYTTVGVYYGAIIGPQAHARFIAAGVPGWDSYVRMVASNHWLVAPPNHFTLCGASVSDNDRRNRYVKWSQVRTALGSTMSSEAIKAFKAVTEEDIAVLAAILAHVKGPTETGVEAAWGVFQSEGGTLDESTVASMQMKLPIRMDL